jgi:hypothetical protein
LKLEKPIIQEHSTFKIAQFIRHLGIGFFSAIITGILAGLFLRLLMKIIALVFPHMARGFTIEGTIALVLVGIGFSLANSMIYTFIHPYLGKNWVQKGLVYGFINLTVYGIPFFLSNPDNDLFGPQAPLGIILFSILFLLAGQLLAILVDKATIWTNQSKQLTKFFYFVFAILIIPALVMSGGIVYEVFTELIPAIQENF